MTITDTLASFIHDTSADDIPRPVRDWGVDLLLDTIASALAGVRGDETGMIRNLAAKSAGGGGISVIGGTTSSAVGAAMINGYQVTATTVCDVHKPLLFHVTPEIVPPVLALAEERSISGAEVLTSIVVGCEVAIRVGTGLDYPVFRSRGWHSPGVSGPLGGSAAAGRMLALSVDEQRNALALAGSQSSGSFAGWGTAQIKWHQSRGAASGLFAALLAAEGFGASPDILTSPDGGLLTTFSDGGKPEAVIDDLGQTWATEELTLRRWPVASALQSLVLVCQQLHGQGLRASDVEDVLVQVGAGCYDMYKGMGWDSQLQSHMSPRYIAAVVLSDGVCWLDQFDAARRGDPAVSSLADRVRLEARDDLAPDGAIVDVVRRDGSTLRLTCDVPPGDPKNRLPREDLVAKFHEARSGLIGDAAADRLLDGLLDLDNVADFAEIGPLLQADAGAR